MNSLKTDTNQWCKNCRFSAANINGQLLCSLSWKQPSFEGSCPDFVIYLAINKDRKQILNAQVAAVSLWIRMINLIIDIFCIWIFGFLMGIVLGMFSVGFNFTDLWHNMENYILLPLYFLSYYVFFELSWSRSIGKIFTKSIVVDTSGRRPSFKQIIIRSFCRLIPIDPFTFFGKRSTGWHDTISNTRVVTMRALRKAKQIN